MKQAGFGDIRVRRSFMAGEMAGTKLYSVAVSARKGPAVSSAVTVTESGQTVKTSSCCCG